MHLPEVRQFRLARNGRVALVVFMLVVLVMAGSVQAQDGDAEPEPPTVRVLEENVVPNGINTVIQIPVSKDAFISSAFPNSNFGNATITKAGYEVGGAEAMRIVLQFSLSSIPDNAIINSAQFRYYLSEVRPVNDTPMGFKAEFMNASWSETGVTWNNANFLGGSALPIGEIPNTIGWQVNDGTLAVRAWHSGARPNHGVLITGDEGPERNRSRVFYSRERAGFYPNLIVDYTLSCDTQPPVASVSALPAYSPKSYEVRWSGTDTAPSNCTPSGIAYYDVQYRVNGGSWVAWKNQTASTSATFASGENGNHYEFRARAVDKAGNAQAFTSNAQASTRVDTVAPNAQMNPLDTYTFSPAFYVQWTGSDNLSGIASYDVQWRIAGGTWRPLIENTTQTSFQFTGGENGVTYEFRARARDVVGNVQAFSEQAQTQTTVVTHPVAQVHPFAPIVLKPTAAMTATFTVNWSFTSGPTTPDETRIYFRYGGGNWQLWEIFDYPQVSASFPWESMGMGDGIYEFEAVGVNTLGQIEPRQMQAEAFIWVDMADAVAARVFMPVVER